MTQELLGRVHRELIDVLKSINQDEIHDDGHDFHKLLKDVEKALAQPEQEPVAWEQFYTTAPQRTWIETNNSVCAILRQAHDMLAMSSLPPKREWVGLTPEEFHKACWESYVDPVTGECSTGDREYAVRWTEAKLKEKNK